MKFSRLIILLGRNISSRFLIFTLLLSCFSFYSCKDDMDSFSRSSRISFTSEIMSSWTPLSRSVSDVADCQASVVSLHGDGCSLFLHTAYVDSIASFYSDSCSDVAMSSRAASVTNADMYNRFGISAYSYNDTWNESKTPDYFYNATASRSGNGNYTLSSVYYWPGESYKMRFFAYAPNDNDRYVLSGSAYPGTPTISVTIPDDVNEQQDLLVAKTDEISGNFNSAIPLTFNHALSAIKFVCGNEMEGGVVKSVSLKNVYSCGIYNMGTQSWSSVDKPSTFSQILEKTTTGTAGEALTAEAQTFMMIPQNLPEDAQLEIVFADKSGMVHTLTADLKGMVWPIGKTVIYKISNSSISWDYTLEVTGPSDFTYEGGMQKYDVISYRQNNAGVQEPVAWTTQYSEDGIVWTDTKPSWLTSFTASGEGGTTAQSYDIAISAQTGINDSPHTLALQSASPKGSESSPYNLANQSDGGAVNENTANCYVIGAPGYYSFPLVYGNAIKNNTTNTSAYIYSSNPSSDRELLYFVNHAGKAISDPYIINNGCVPTKAELVWQDEKDLVTEIKYNKGGANGGNISFKVDKNTIRQGNAVIAIKDENDQTLWSWHIWVTDENISNTIAVTNKENKKYNFMPVYLGWCDGSAMFYAERSCKIRFRSGEVSRDITVKQASNSITIDSNSTSYQWGRKDPFRGAFKSDWLKTYYDKDGVAGTAPHRSEDLSADIKSRILNPDIIDKNQRTTFYYNLWGYSMSTQSQIAKTVYDPCPVGFTVPDREAFTGWTIPETTFDRSDINGEFIDATGDWIFYSGPNRTGSQIIFQVVAVQGFGFAVYYKRSPECATTWGADYGSYVFYTSAYMWNGVKMCYNVSFAQTYVPAPTVVRPIQEK